MSYQPSMVDARLVHYKVRIRLMSYRPSMVDAQLIHYHVRVRLMSYRPSMVDAQPIGSSRSPGKEVVEEGPMNLAYMSVHPEMIYILLKVHLFLPG